ncbi:MAG TPA: molybdenum cofactor guanylyltransferase [Phycisphaerae bacterium]|nr:molybdenum cofactor guanylyltransferase [Phycisphaerae bacterium]
MDTLPVVAVLAGGRSSRMGADKALLTVGGVCVLERVATAALEVSARVMVVGRERPAAWPERLDVTFVRDEEAEGAMAERSAGPLVGLITALRQAGGPMLLLACDLPLVTSGLLRVLIASHRAENLATLAATPEGPEPLCAIYTPGLLPTLEGMLRENRRALRALVRAPGVATFPVPVEYERELLNVNTPADLAEAERRLRG